MSDVEFLDEPPVSDKLTEYDRAHLKTYMRLLDAAADDADWKEAVQVIFRVDPSCQPERAALIHSTHLARARWMSERGYKDLLTVGCH